MRFIKLLFIIIIFIVAIDTNAQDNDDRNVFEIEYAVEKNKKDLSYIYVESFEIHRYHV